MPLTALLIFLYLLAIVVANLSVGYFGPTALVFTAWALIPFDLTVKDTLQEHWTGRGVVVRLGALVLTGSALSAALSMSAHQIALASFAAFSMSGLVDSLILAKMEHYPKLVRVNGSNVGGAVVDSLVFQLVAFGTVSPWLFVWQSGAKLLGGFVWSLILNRVLWRKP